MYTFQKNNNIRKYQRNCRIDLHTGFGCNSGRYTDCIKRAKKRKSKLSRVSNYKFTELEIRELICMSKKFNFSSWVSFYYKEKENPEIFKHQDTLLDKQEQHEFDYNLVSFRRSSKEWNQGLIFGDIFDTPYYRQLIKNLINHYGYKETQTFRLKDILCQHYTDIFSTYKVDMYSLSYILLHYQKDRIICLNPENGFLLAYLDEVYQQFIHESSESFRKKIGPKNFKILNKYYPIELSWINHPELHIEGFNLKNEDQHKCPWWKLNDPPFNSKKYKSYVLLMLDYDKHLLDQYEGSFVILLDKRVVLPKESNFHTLYRHRDFVIYQKGGQKMSFYN